MPESTVTDPTVLSTGPRDCAYSWCTADHSAYGWEQDNSGNPVRTHEFNPETATRGFAYVVLNETRYADGRIGLDGPYVVYNDGEAPCTIEEALEALSVTMANAGTWREIATEFDKSAHVVR